MKKLLKFFVEVNKTIRDGTDDYVADYHNSTLHLIVINLWAVFLMIISSFCFLIIITHHWMSLTPGFPWSAVPGAVLAPFIIWRSIHVITSASWHLTNS